MSDRDLLQNLLETDADSSINRVTKIVIGSAYNVANSLGCGFLEKVYENALTHEIRKCGLTVEQQKDIRVFYDNVEVGFYAADLLVERSVLVELKTVKSIDDIHRAMPKLS